MLTDADLSRLVTLVAVPQCHLSDCPSGQPFQSMTRLERAKIVTIEHSEDEGRSTSPVNITDRGRAVVAEMLMVGQEAPVK